MNEALTPVLNTLTSLPPETVPLLASALGLSAVQMKINKLFESDKVKQTITLLLALATALFPAILGYLSDNPKAIGAHTAFVFSAMTLFYRYIVKDAAANFAAFKDYKQARADIKDLTVIKPTEQKTNIDEFLG